MASSWIGRWRSAVSDRHPTLTSRLADATVVAFDCEMTGLDPRRDAICAIGAVRIRHGKLTDETFDTLVDPGRPIGAAARAIHGISDDDVRGRPRLDAAIAPLRNFIGDDIPLAHVASLDLSFLAPALKRAGLPSLERVLDTAVLARTLMPAHHDVTLESLCAYFGIPLDGRHSALGDARLAARLYLRLVPYLEHRGALTLERALHWGDAHHASALR